MDAAWTNLNSVAGNSIDPIWLRFAKLGRESAIFAPLSKYPKASAWLAGNMSLSNDYIIRKLGAMLAGWIEYPPRAELLSEMLTRERIVFGKEPLFGNSVGEDIMFAATRWSGSPIPQIKKAGIDTLAAMIKDAITGTPWNTANWAAANLYKATDGRHEIFQNLVNAPISQIKDLSALSKIADAIRQNDRAKLDRCYTPPSELCVLSTDDPQYQMAASLWKAAEAAETASV